MADIRWSPDAARDLDAFARWYREHGGSIEERFLDDVAAAVERLPQRPLMGRVHRDRPDRRLVSLVSWHKVIHYRVFDDHIGILAIRDTRMKDALR